MVRLQMAVFNSKKLSGWFNRHPSIRGLPEDKNSKEVIRTKNLISAGKRR